ncbi:lysozyme-like isoform X2 [Penaeus japonicus]|uniref:lysozyme-like isoform X2 n=1 Tax=Penaeus japonicus TaxID=27405 RepID=UPI001C71546E|nr:lysozyme-like isoform X2 [Penaeus japonicus]
MALIKQAMIADKAVIFALVYGEEVDPNCLGCLCEASTKCNVSTACHVPYPGAYFCGPFLISWAYWADAGKPIIDGDNVERKGAFESCVQDLYCGAETVRRYMAKFLDDCDGNGVVTCIDVIRTHKLGRDGCNGVISQGDKFWAQYQTCASRFNL